MRRLLAHIAEPSEIADRRRTQRRTLRLDVAAQTATAEPAVVIRDLSRTGLRIESETGFAVGETFILILPEIGAAPARIVRAEGRLFGCEFLSPVPASAISAALLKASPDDDDEEAGGSVGQRNADRPYAPRRARAILFAAVTALFTAAILLFIVALAFLTFS